MYPILLIVPLSLIKTIMHRRTLSNANYRKPDKLVASSQKWAEVCHAWRGKTIVLFPLLCHLPTTKTFPKQHGFRIFRGGPCSGPFVLVGLASATSPAYWTSTTTTSTGSPKTMMTDLTMFQRQKLGSRPMIDGGDTN